MPKLKLKKNIQKILGIIVVVFLLGSIGLFSYLKISKQKAYEQTYEYKLLSKGYNNDEVKLLQSKFKNEQLDYILSQEKNDTYLNLVKEKYFIYDKFYDYLNYYSNNNNLSLTEVITKVNTNTSRDYYEEPIKTDISKKELMLVNKYYYLDENYEPENLVTIPLTYAYGELGSQKITENTYNAFLNLWNAAKEAGYTLVINSSYRDYKKQEEIYNEYKKQGTDYADKYAARAGYSEHQTGYAFDMFAIGTNSKNFHESNTYQWLLDNAYKYGFILRYPEDKVNITGYSFESWHYRYVGVDAATYIHDNNITFDEYYVYFVETHS